jgi:hypothetical protein
MEEETPSPWSEAVDGLLTSHIDLDQKVLDGQSLRAALVKALGEAYEKGLADGLSVKAKGPDA